MLNYWKKGVMKMTNEQELFVLIIIFAVTFRYLYKNRIIYETEKLVFVQAGTGVRYPILVP